MAAQREPNRELWLMAALPVLALVGAAALLLFDRENGIPVVLTVQEQVESAEGRLSELEDERDRLIREVRGLRGNPFTIESMARGRLGMVRPNEIVVRLERPGPGIE